MDAKYTETIPGLGNEVTVCMEISREDAEKIFKDNNETAKNVDQEEDDTYIGGELQFTYTASETEPHEVLLFPMYNQSCVESIREILVGDFIDVTGQFSDLEKESAKYRDNIPE